VINMAQGLSYIKIDPTTGRKVVVSVKDVSPYWIYDTKTLNDSTKAVSFFSNVDKNNPVATNMLQNNVLPNGWKFHALAMRIVPDFSADANLIASVIFNSVIIFKKESYEVFKAPTYTFNAGAGVYGKPTNGMPSSEALLPFPMQLEIQGMTPFSADMIVSPSVTFGDGVNLDVKCVVDGIVYKNIVTA